MATGIPSPDQLDFLETRAHALLRRVEGRDRASGDATPVVVEFAGSPKAGKSTTIDIVSHFFKRMGFKVWASTEGASKRTPYMLKDDLVAFNTWALNYAISELLVAVHSRDRQHVILLDRGPFDVLAWLGLLREERDLTSEAYDTIAAYARHDKWAGLVDRLYLFTCDPALSLQRETRSKLTLRPGRAMNEARLTELLSQYRALKQELEDYPLKAIESRADSNVLGTAYEVASDLLQIMEAKFQAGASEADK